MQLTPVSLYVSFSSSFEAQSISSLTPSSSLSRPCHRLVHFLIILRDLSTRSMTLPCYPNCAAYFSEFSFTHHTVPLLHSLQVLTLLLYLPHSPMWPFHGFLITNIFASSSVWILKCSSLTSLPLPRPSLPLLVTPSDLWKVSWDNNLPPPSSSLCSCVSFKTLRLRYLPSRTSVIPVFVSHSRMSLLFTIVRISILSELYVYNLYTHFREGQMEGCELTLSYNNTKITTDCWIIINQKKPWNLARKIPYIQRQRRSHSELVGEAQSLSSQIPYPPGGQPTNWKTIIPQKFFHKRTASQFFHRSENSKPQSGFPAWASSNWSKSP